MGEQNGWFFEVPTYNHVSLSVIFRPDGLTLLTANQSSPENNGSCPRRDFQDHRLFTLSHSQLQNIPKWQLYIFLIFFASIWWQQFKRCMASYVSVNRPSPSSLPCLTGLWWITVCMRCVPLTAYANEGCIKRERTWTHCLVNSDAKVEIFPIFRGPGAVQRVIGGGVMTWLPSLLGQSIIRWV